MYKNERGVAVVMKEHGSETPLDPLEAVKHNSSHFNPEK